MPIFQPTFDCKKISERKFATEYRLLITRLRAVYEAYMAFQAALQLLFLGRRPGNAIDIKITKVHFRGELMEKDRIKILPAESKFSQAFQLFHVR
jgi:hypothetical protein